MSSFIAYCAGVCTVPLVGAVVFAYLAAVEPGLEIQCGCGYCTGPMEETWRITCWLRWRWHKLTTGHHTRRRRRSRKGLEL